MICIDKQMPTNCYDCWIRQNMGCRIANDSGWLNDRRDDKCPLKAQEPVEPIIEKTYGTAECEDPWGRLIFCGACGKRINEKYNPDEDDKFCKHCGRQVKWE